MVTKMGYIIIFINILIIGLSVAQVKSIEVKNDKRDSLLRENYARSVERIAKNIDTSKTQIIQKDEVNKADILGAVAKAGFRYNAATNTLEQVTPIFCLRPANEIQLIDSATGKYRFTFSSINAPSTGFAIKLYIVLEFDNQQFLYLGSINPLPSKITIEDPHDYFTTCNFNVKFNKLFVLLKGDIQNLQGKHFSVDQLYVFDPQSRVAELPMGDLEDLVREKIKHGDKRLQLKQSTF